MGIKLKHWFYIYWLLIFCIFLDVDIDEMEGIVENFDSYFDTDAGAGIMIHNCNKIKACRYLNSIYDVTYHLKH